MSAAPDPDAFMALTERLAGDDPRLTMLGAALLAALQMDIARDSRSFARTFGVAHALVLRELSALERCDDRIRLVSRDARTMRSHYVLGTRGAEISAA
jgi:hypothetical protein